MLATTNILSLVLAGGQGTRLLPLTEEQAKPALPFAGGHRIIDFVLSNLFNSGVSPIYVLAQYKPDSLIEHLNRSWGLSSPRRKRVLKVVLSRGSGPQGFRGTADAVYQNLELIERHRPDLVAVFAADHVYRMDVRQMADFHARHDADVTVSAVPVPVGKASSFGIIGVDEDGRIREFREKPHIAEPIPGKPGFAYASMGNYLFSPGVLVEALSRARQEGGHDFGMHVLPELARSRRAYAYDFATNRVPGVQPCEECAYWRDVGTLDAYHEAQRDVLGPAPRFRLSNPQWPIHGHPAHRNPAPRAGERAQL